MRKNIFSSLAFLLASFFSMTGCGSTSNTGDGSLSTAVAVEIQESQIALINATDFALPLTFVKKLDSTYHVELSNFSLSVSGCTIANTAVFSPTILVLDGDLNTQESLTINGSFVEQNCTATAYVLTATQTVTKDGKEKIEDISFAYNAVESTATTTPIVDGYSIINATTPLQIAASNTDYAITMQVLKDGFAAPSVSVKLKPFSSIYGGIKTTTTYTVATDENGIATFDYLSPTSLPMNGSSVTLEAVLVDENDTAIGLSQFIVLNFNAYNSIIFDYNLTNVTTPIIVTNDNQQEEISVYVIDTANIGVPGKTVSISVIADGYGSVTTSTALTDTAGKATFDYTGPSSLVGLTDTTTTMSFTENGITVARNVEIRIAPLATVSDYVLTNARTPVTITSVDQNETIDIQLVKNTMPVIDARPCTTTDSTITVDCVIPESIPREYGRILNANGSTGASGYVNFNYQGPNAEDISAADPYPTTHTFNVYYIDKDGKIAATAPVTININIP